MNKKLINISKLVALLIATNISAQRPTMQKLQVKSPESFAFEKYGNIPVNLYTGSIDLKVPVTSIEENGVNIPVALSYDSSGFIPHKKSEIAGVNWTLLAGGRVTRTLRGTADEYVGDPNYPGTSFDSPKDVHGFLKGVKMNPSTNVNAYNLYGGTGNINTTNNTISWTMGPTSAAYEGTPDVFNFHVMGLSGKFMVGNDGTVLVESDDPNIKVDLSEMAMYGGANFCGNDVVSIIKIIDGKGNQYFFGGDLSKYEVSYYNKSVSFQEGFQGFPTINAFSLSKIIFNDGKTVEFNYFQGSLQQQYDFCHNPNILTGTATNPTLSIEAYFQEGARADDWYYCLAAGGPAQACGGGTISDGASTESFSLLKKSVLTSIKYGNNEIKINYINTGYPIKHRYSAPKYLNEWVIDNIETFSYSKLIKKTQFAYDHLGGEFKRPFLKSVKDIFSNQEYTFNYNVTYPLPPYYTKGIDHWGYWNGNDSNVYLSPVQRYNYVTGDYTLVNTYRDPSPFFFNQGLLNQITYPTKGYTTFEYEPQYYGKRIERNSASNFLPTLTNNSGFAGGTRIKEIKNYSEGGLTSQKEYKYITSLNETTSSGILMHWPRYLYYWEFTQQGDFGPEWHKTYIRTSANIIQSSLDNYNVGYGKVFEIEPNKGYTEYNFSTYENHPDQLNPDADNIREYISTYPNIQPINLYKNFNNLFGTDKSVTRGKLLGQKVFEETSMNPIKIIEFQYNDNINFNPNSLKDNNNYVSINHMTGKWVQGYKKYMNASYIKNKILKEYFGNIELKTITDYSYDSNSHMNLTKENNIMSDNTEVTKKYSYSEDLSVNNNLLTSKNMTGIPLVVEVKKNNKNLSKTETIYPISLSTPQTGNLVLPLSEKSYDTQTDVPSTEVTYDKYDSKGNLQQYTSKDGISTTIIWGYNQTQPIAKIEGAKLSDISQTLIDNIVNSSINDAQLSTDASEQSLISALDVFRNNSALSNYQISTYTYDPLIGVKSITPPSGIREIYVYDTSNRLKEVKQLDKDAAGNPVYKIVKEYKYNYKN
jgi:hypothetical protein